MSTNAPARRGFLRSLVSLPLIGGGVTLIGNPTRAAEPVTTDLLDSYNAWLIIERRLLIEEMYGREVACMPDPNEVGFYKPNNGGWDFHRQYPDQPASPAPSTRAAIVLSAVGCEWRPEPRRAAIQAYAERRLSR